MTLLTSITIVQPPNFAAYTYDNGTVAYAPWPPNDGKTAADANNFLVSGKTITQYVAPVIVPQSLTRVQFFTIAALNGLITQQEAIDAVTNKSLPALFTNFVATLPSDQQFTATMLLSGTATFDRNHPFVTAFTAQNNMTSEQVDQIFIQGATII